MPNVKTEEDLICFTATNDHKQAVYEACIIFANMIKVRGRSHDNSKLEDTEFPLFAKVTPNLANTTYNSEEYKQYLEEIRPALNHHYANNRHHPEHFKNGVSDMNLVDIIEMFADWYCSSKRHNDGNIRKSIDENQKRFNLSNDLVQILINTIEILDI